MLKYLSATALAVSLFAAGGAAKAQDAKPFYAGKDIHLTIGYGVGGGYDAYARLLAAHLGKHLAGNPNILPENMPGAGSLKSANYLFSVAPKDGTAMATFAQQIAVAPLLGDAKFDAREFSWIGSIAGEVSICITSTRSPIKSWDDMLTKEHSFGGEGRGSDVDTLTIALQTLFGTKTKLVTGYPGTSEMLLAIERGELDGLCGMSYSSLVSRFQTLLDEKKVRIILQAATRPELGLDVPNVLDLAKTPEQKSLLGFILAPNVMGRPYAAPPGLPKERLQELRTAFDETMKDPDFLADAKVAKLQISPATGTEIEKVVDDLYETPKDVIAKVTEISGGKGK